MDETHSDGTETPFSTLNLPCKSVVTIELNAGAVFQGSLGKSEALFIPVPVAVKENGGDLRLGVGLG